MNHEPTNRYGSPPPMVTHSPYPTMAMPVYGQQPQYHQPMPRKRGAGAGTWITAIACMIGALCLGVGVGFAASDGATPSSCTEALELADELTAHTGTLGDLSAEAIEAAASWDTEALDSIAVEVETLKADWDSTYAAYETARDECVDGGGSL